eukprot:TRINITY_DN5109_c0_g1_i1.p1 TRINITY_DN5109_c0_g1~~TRINITY_DN5109_c0_g1_i1.p1  ORF type:complete len:336 (+),score=52.92 TRINITY_DN5109_c0_g1_i1:80-1009(+)
MLCLYVRVQGREDVITVEVSPDATVGHIRQCLAEQHQLQSAATLRLFYAGVPLGADDLPLSDSGITAQATIDAQAGPMLRVRYHCPALLVTEPGDGSVTVTVPMDVTDGGRIIVFDPPLSCTESGKWEVQVLSAIRGGAHYFGLVGQSVWDSMLENIVEKQGEQQNAPTVGARFSNPAYGWIESNGSCIEDGLRDPHRVIAAVSLLGPGRDEEAEESRQCAWSEGSQLTVECTDGTIEFEAPGIQCRGQLPEWHPQELGGRELGDRELGDRGEAGALPAAEPAAGDPSGYLCFLYLFNRGDSCSVKRVR